MPASDVERAYTKKDLSVTKVETTSTPQEPASSPNSTKSKSRPVARAAYLKKRHFGIILSFLLFVIFPIFVSAYYMMFRASDQYMSTVGFSVRTEASTSPTDILRGLGGIGGLSGGASDLDILYKYIQSQALVEKIDQDLDLVEIFSRSDNDPVFGYDRRGSIEDLIKYWNRMVHVFYDNSSGLIEIRVFSFTPEDSRAISQAIFSESSDMVNKLSMISQEDTMRYARDELDRAMERLKESRESLTTFRSENHVANPESEIITQTGIITALQQQYSDALIELDLLRRSGNPADPRIAQIEQRLEVIKQRIEEEKLKFSTGTTGDLSNLISEYEGLVIDLEFSQQSYLASLAALDGARAEARRKSRYLAAYITPTLPERATHPRRIMAVMIVGVFAVFVWAIGVLLFYSVKDRR